jgi:hypothetical protein
MTHDGDLFERSLLLPVPLSGKNEVALEPRDGSDPQRVLVQGILLERDNVNVLKVVDIGATAWITDARFAVVCSAYSKGGGWVGDPVTMGVLNAVSKARASSRGRGKSLVGQVRYPWIARVGSTPKSGWGSEERLAVDCTEANGSQWRLSLRLPNHANASYFAALIARRSAAYRLVCSEDLDPDERQSLEDLVDAVPIQPKPTSAKNEAYFHEFPTHWNISEKSARFAPTR